MLSAELGTPSIFAVVPKWFATIDAMWQELLFITGNVIGQSIMFSELVLEYRPMTFRTIEMVKVPSRSERLKVLARDNLTTALPCTPVGMACYSLAAMTYLSEHYNRIDQCLLHSGRLST
jgi:hypothetical protein